MSFSNEWERIYGAGGHMSVWPWSDLVSLFMRHLRPAEIAGGADVLELGVGAGANIPFVLSTGGRLAGIDGSETAIALLSDKFGTDARVRLAVGDFTRHIPFEGEFDAVIDRASITHNTEEGVRRAVQGVFDKLKPGGLVFAMTMFSTTLAEFEEGEAGPDAWTRCGFTDGPLANTGNVHFWDEAHIRAVYSQFEIVALELHSIERVLPKGARGFSYWNMVARKPR